MIVGVTAKSFLASELLCQQLIASCPEWQIHFADPDLVESESYLASFLQEATHWIVGRETVSGHLLAKLPKLRVISKYGVGLDNIDFAACQAAEVDVRWRPGVNAQAVAELSLAFMISLCRNIHKGSRLLAEGVWWKNGGIAFSSRTVGIIGAGAIGSRVARLARAFGCRILICDILDKRKLAEKLDGSQVDLENLLSNSDIVTLHVPLTELTHKMINADRLGLMKESAYLINTCRGEVVDQEALKLALQERQIAGAALDVYAEEPLQDKSLYSLDNFIGTAHIGGNSREAVLAMGQAAIDGVKEKGSCLIGNESYSKW